MGLLDLFGSHEIYEEKATEENQSSSKITHNTPPESKLSAERKGYAWRRFFARLIDSIVLAFPLVIASVLLLPASSKGYITNLTIFSALLLTIPYEAYLLSIWGTTIGKRVMGIYIAKREGGLLSVNEAAARSLYVFIYGLGLLGWITNYNCYFLFIQHGVTYWDRELEIDVTYK